MSSLELENRLLKNEVASLNQEMTSVIHRAKSAQDGKYRKGIRVVLLDDCGVCNVCLKILEIAILQHVKDVKFSFCLDCLLHSCRRFHYFVELVQVTKQLQAQTNSHSQSDQIIRELRARESDLTEALSTKDAQLGILRVRLEEADKELLEKKKTVEALTAEKDR